LCRQNFKNYKRITSALRLILVELLYLVVRQIAKNDWHGSDLIYVVDKGFSHD
jgi:hypothetical protein